MQNRFAGLQLFRILCLGKNKVEHCQVFQAIDELLAVVGDLGGELVQDASFLIALLQLQLAHGVVQLDDRKRLNKKRRAARGLVVDHGLDLSLEFGAQGDHVASIALGDDRFLELVGRLGQVALQARHQAVV